MKVQYAVYGLIGIVVILAALSFLTIWIGRKAHSHRFDERQQIARGDAYRFSFWVGFFCYFGMLIYMIQCVEHEPVVEPYLLMFLTICIQAVAFHMYCVVTHSALPFDEKPIGPIVGYSVMGVFHLLGFISRDVKETLPLRGQGTSAWMDLILGGFLLVVALIYLIGALIKEKE